MHQNKKTGRWKTEDKQFVTKQIRETADCRVYVVAGYINVHCTILSILLSVMDLSV